MESRMMRQLTGRHLFVLAVACITVAAFAMLFPQSRAETAIRPTAISSVPIDRFWPFDASEPRNPSLAYLGGLRLWSTNPAFGGLSGLEALGDGRFIAIGDRGSYLLFRLVLTNGRPSRIEDATMGPLKLRGHPDGRTIDAEDIVRIASGKTARPMFAVAMERRSNPVRRFALDSDGLIEQSVSRFPADAARGHNRAIEAVALAPAASPAAGRLVILAERPRENEPHISGWIEGLGRFQVRRRDGFDITAMRFLDDGDLILLERRLRLTDGIAMRLRRIEGRALRPGALLDGDVLIDAGLTQPIDNMEGLAIHRDERGTILTLISDDNFVPLQRTMLLQFRLADKQPDSGPKTL